jgi:hypothetical protein
VRSVCDSSRELLGSCASTVSPYDCTERPGVRRAAGASDDSFSDAEYLSRHAATHHDDMSSHTPPHAHTRTPTHTRAHTRAHTRTAAVSPRREVSVVVVRGEAVQHDGPRRSNGSDREGSIHACSHDTRHTHAAPSQPRLIDATATPAATMYASSRSLSTDDSTATHRAHAATTARC